MVVDLLAWPKIVGVIRDAAAAGKNRVTIAPTVALKIKHTTAAQAAMALLGRELFRYQWTEHRPAPTGPAWDQLEIE